MLCIRYWLSSPTAGRSRVILYGWRCGVLLLATRMNASLGLDTGVAPVGADVWQETSADVGMLPQDAVLTDALTGTRIQCNGPTLDLGRALHYFPAAILHYDMQ